jgi:hypothetical protein
VPVAESEAEPDRPARCFADSDNRKGFCLRFSPFLLCLALVACGPYPDDISGTFDLVEQSGEVRVGLTELRPQDEQSARRFVARLERATGSKARFDRGPAESQLARLEEGDLDLVISEFAADTPWATSVAILEPLATRRSGKRRLELAPAARNGENRWIGLIEREVRDGQAGA